MLASLVSQLFRKKKQHRNVVRDRLDILHEQFPEMDLGHCQTICDVEAYTMTSPERLMALCEATEYVINHEVPGDIVECGVWRGGSMAAVARTIINLDTSIRELWMYDTYEGMSEPTDKDVDFLGRDAAHLLATENQQIIDDPTSIWCNSPLSGVKATMQETGYNSDYIRYVVGKVEETLPQQVPDQIALLRLDTDWYESTKCELEHLFPRLVPGGVLIVDDYGHWEGCRRAVDEYFADHGIKFLLNRIDYTGRIGVKSVASDAAGLKDSLTSKRVA